MPKIRFMYMMIIVSLFITACTNSQDNNHQQEKKTEVEQSSYQPDELMTRSDIADHLADLAVKVTDVEGATSIVAGPYTVVGIDIDEKVGRDRTGAIKHTVLEALEHDPYGKEAVVIADADMTERLRGMRDSIQDGEPIQGITDELANIVGRYMPTAPIDDGQDQKDIPVKDEEKTKNRD